MTRLLENKNAVIYGAGGGIGGGVARTFAREVAVVDALDERAVDDHVRTVVGATGSIANVTCGLVAG